MANTTVNSFEVLTKPFPNVISGHIIDQQSIFVVSVISVRLSFRTSVSYMFFDHLAEK